MRSAAVYSEPWHGTAEMAGTLPPPPPPRSSLTKISFMGSCSMSLCLKYLPGVWASFAGYENVASLATGCRYHTLVYVHGSKCGRPSRSSGQSGQRAGEAEILTPQSPSNISVVISSYSSISCRRKTKTIEKITTAFKTKPSRRGRGVGKWVGPRSPKSSSRSPLVSPIPGDGNCFSH